jgi:PAS domain S-box-containing protein
VRWNKSATELFGYSMNELREKSVFDLYPDKERLDKMLTLLRQKGFIRKFGIKVVRKDGRIIPFEMSISLLKDKDGNVVGSVGVARDLSDIKRVIVELRALNRRLQEEILKSKAMEKELRKARDELEKVVQERTAKLDRAGDLLQKSMKRIKDITDTQD